MVSGMAAEPKRDNVLVERGFRLLCLNHTLLGYISALGAHRENRADSPAILSLLNDAVCYIDSALQREVDESVLAQPLESVTQQIALASAGDDDTAQLIAQQLTLIVNLLPEFTTLANEVTNKTPTPAEPLSSKSNYGL